MRPILAGLETEYGLLVEGRGAEDQVEDAMALVRGYPGECFAFWDYRYESPRSDLRGFKLERLAHDPTDAQFDRGKAHPIDRDVRSDRILPNGARFYNDHGHPEYSTPECLSLEELAAHDAAGELAVLRAAQALELETGRGVRVYKNNTDFHGASYGTHESYLVPRSLPFQRLYESVLPMLVVRQILTGAGKVGSESGKQCVYQLSQRADFLVEPLNAETLYRRPIFNTRDEPHADPSRWVRLHVISGDANMMASCTKRKVALVRLAIALAEHDQAPAWRLSDPVRTFQAISRDESFEFCVPLEGRSWTNAFEVVESYLSAAERTLELDAELIQQIDDCRRLMAAMQDDPLSVSAEVDWAAKRRMLESFMDEEGMNWRDPALQAYDLEYHNIDPEQGLYHALQGMGEAEAPLEVAELESRLREVREPTRARARSLSLTRFGSFARNACWHSVSFELEGQTVELQLPPDAHYGEQLFEAANVETFIDMVRGVS